MEIKRPYDALIALSKKSALFQSISALLEWDLETYIPPQGIKYRAEQSAAIASLAYEQMTTKAFRETLSSLVDLETGKLISPDPLSPAEAASVMRLRRNYLQTVKLPLSFIQEFSLASSASVHAWRIAREENAFSLFLPHLEKIVKLCRKKAELLGYAEHPYDALIDWFEPDMTTSKISSLLDQVSVPLIKLLRHIEGKPLPSASFLSLPYPTDRQFDFGKNILEAMGLSSKFSRLDTSSHPMCVPIHLTDVRLTTKLDLHSPLVNILSTMHEGGHALYHSNLPPEYGGTPLSEATSLGIDESQSRTWETIVGKSLPMWEHYFPLLQKAFPENLKEVYLDQFYRAINIVTPSYIRTESDELTYNLHVIIRFEIEKQLIEGSLKVADLPRAWNEKMETFLGITPPTDTEGCLQDIHWSMGIIGYFPTYTLGNLYAAQFFEVFVKEHPDWAEKVKKGELTFIANWQRDNIHRFGQQYLAEELCEKITGKSLDHKAFIDYLEKKYLSLYPV